MLRALSCVEGTVDLALLGRGWIIGFTIAAAVGPISLLVMRRTLAEGRVIGLASGLGAATADAAYGAIAAFGLSAVTAGLVDARRALGLVGGLYLFWLAWRTARATPGTTARDTERQLRPAGAYLSIVALTLTNPMTILSFAALFAGLGVSGTSSLGPASVTVGVFAGSGAWWLLLTAAVGAFRARITTRWLRAVNVGSGIAIGAFAATAIALAVH